MIDAKVDILARDLGRLLVDMTKLHGELATHMRSKLEAMRQADSNRIQSITARERALADRVKERESLRRALTKRIVIGLGLDLDDHEALRLSDLAEYFAEPRRSQLLVGAAGLKEKVQEIEQLQLRTTLITKEMLKHMEAVFTVMTAGPDSSGAYSRSGARVTSARASVFEAVG